MEFKDFFEDEACYQAYIIRLEKKIRSFSNSFMSNSKWKKLFVAICQNQDLIKQCEIYNFFEPCVNELVFRNIQSNLGQYIQQEYISNQITTAEYPTFYREIQYLEFLKSWNGNQIGKFVEPIKQTQDIEQIRTYLSRFGEFRFEQTDNFLRILGYS